jgi:hypothetical protein
MVLGMGSTLKVVEVINFLFASVHNLTRILYKAQI